MSSKTKIHYQDDEGGMTMEKMFGKIMEGCMKGMSEDDRKRMIEKMVTMCPCEGKELSEENMKAIREKMMAFCGSKMERLSACFRKSYSTADQTCCDKSV
jgi:hypothetical protein